jgi:hypothetical protein
VSTITELVDAYGRAVSRCARDAEDTPESAYDWGQSEARTRLLAAVAEMEKDAERYRFLRSHDADRSLMIRTEARMDDDVDRCMAAQASLDAARQATATKESGQ